MTRGLTVAAVLVLAQLLVGCGTTVPSSQVPGSQSGGTATAGLSGGVGPSGSGSGAESGGTDGVESPNSAPTESGNGPAGGVSSTRSGGSSVASAPAGSSLGTVMPPGSSAPGSAIDRAPIQIGLLYLVNDGAQSVGINNGNTVTEQQVFQDLVAFSNAHGGLAGRHIEPVYAAIHTDSTSYDSEFSAACATFTQDNHVAVVFSLLGYYSEEMSQCLTTAKVPQIVGDATFADDYDLSRYPYLIGPDALSANEQAKALIDHFAAVGYFSPADKIGVVIEGCPFNDRVFSDTVQPELARLHLDLKGHVDTSCLENIGDAGDIASQVQNAVLQFKSTGVDRVFFVSESSQGNLLLFFSEGAQSQMYFPHYALTSLAIPEVLPQNAPHAELANAVGVGWIPAVDTQTLSQAPANPQAQSCLADLRGQGLQPGAYEDFYLAFGGCDTFFLYGALLRLTRGNASVGAVMSASNGLGTSYRSAMAYAGATDLGVNRAYGASEGREFGWDAGCSCFVYQGSAFALGG